jgi:hypothetical protein
MIVRATNVFVLATALLGGCVDQDENTADEGGVIAEPDETAPAAREPLEIPLKEAKLLIEHNATGLDTGFQIFLDGVEWRNFRLTGPGGAPVAAIKALGELRTFGFTEVFLETQEPPNADVPIPEVLARLPAGEYEFETVTIDGVEQDGTARFSHTIPAGAVLTRRPASGAVISRASDVVFAWNHVTNAIHGGTTANVEFYQLLVNRIDVPRQKNGFGRNFMEIYIPSNVRSMRVPREFLQPNAEYEWEVFAIEANGNQTFVTDFFRTN